MLFSTVQAVAVNAGLTLTDEYLLRDGNTLF